MIRQPAPPALFRRKLWNWLRAPSVLVTSIAGASSLVFAAISGHPWGWWGVAGGALLACSAFAAWYRWRYHSEELDQQAWTDAWQGIRNEHLLELQKLRSELRQDRDLASIELVKRLRDIFLRILDVEPRHNTHGFDRDSDIRYQMRALYDSCLKLVRRSLEMRETAKEIATPAKREALLGQRSQLLGQVELSMRHLNESLDQLQTARVKQDPDEVQDHQRLQSELDMGLEVARNVEQRLDELEREIRAPDRTRE